MLRGTQEVRKWLSFLHDAKGGGAMNKKQNLHLF